MNWIAALCALPPGALIARVLVVSNHRDREEDQANGKKTLAVVFGIKGTQIEDTSLMIIAYLILAVLILMNVYSASVLLPLLSTPIAVNLIRQNNGKRSGKKS